MPEGMITIDPGVTAGTGIAHFLGDKLFSVALAKNNDELERLFLMMGMSVSRLVIEKPQIYDRRRWKGDPNDLIGVAIVAGYAAGLLRFPARKVEYVTPSDWKGQQPKKVNHAQTMARLSVGELGVLNAYDAPKSKMHNVLDAVGIGLWKLGRR